MESCSYYDPDKGVEFSTYAYYWVKNYIITVLNQETRYENAKENYESKSKLFPVEKTAYTETELERLDEQKQRILELYSEGHSVRDIAEEIEDDISYRTVARRLDKIGLSQSALK